MPPATPRSGKSSDAFLLGVALVLSVGVIVWAAYIDRLVVVAWRHWLGWVLTLGPAVCVAVLSLSSEKRSVRWIGCGALAVTLALVFVPWTPRKRFVWDLYTVKPGMTVEEVEDIMGGYVKGSGWAIPEGPPPLVRGPGDPEDLDARARADAARAAYRPPAYPTGEERAHATGTMVYRWNKTDPRFNADWGTVEFKDGRVVEVGFSPD